MNTPKTPTAQEIAREIVDSYDVPGIEHRNSLREKITAALEEATRRRELPSRVESRAACTAYLEAGGEERYYWDACYSWMMSTRAPGHECVLPTGCSCYSGSLEPADDCPTHGVPDRRCAICGRFARAPAEKPLDGSGRCELQRLRDALEMMWDKYENGTPCYEEPEGQEGFIGNAVLLDDFEEGIVLTLIPATCTRKATAEKGSE